MPTEPANKTSLVRVLESEIDELWYADGFKRRKGGLMYSRNLEDSRQEVHMFLSSKPLGHPNDEMRLQPTIHIKIPQVSQLAIEMVGNPRLLANSPELIAVQPLDMLQRIDTKDYWLANTEEQLVNVCKNIYEFFSAHGKPVLHNYRSARGITESYERNDRYPLRQQHTHIFIAAAYILQDQLDHAQSVLEKHLGSPGLRTRYSAAHEYVRHNKPSKSDPRERTSS